MTLFKHQRPALDTQICLLVNTYADRQYKDYERTLKFMASWLDELAGRARISLPYWMNDHRYNHRIPTRFGIQAENDVVFRPFAEDSRYVREWCSGGPRSKIDHISLGSSRTEDMSTTLLKQQRPALDTRIHNTRTTREHSSSWNHG